MENQNYDKYATTGATGCQMRSRRNHSVEESSAIEDTDTSAVQEKENRKTTKLVVIKTMTKIIKYRRLKKKDQFCRPIKIKNAGVKATYSICNGNKKRFSINRSTGKILHLNVINRTYCRKYGRSGNYPEI